MDLYVTLVVVLALTVGSQGTFLPHVGITNGGLGLHPGHLPGAMIIGGGGGSGGTVINGGGSMSFNGGGSAVVNGGSQTNAQGINVGGGGGSGNSVINAGGATTVNGGSSHSYNNQVYENRVVNGGSHGQVQGGGNVVGVVNGPPKPCP